MLFLGMYAARDVVIDDLYISYAYALTWLESSAMTYYTSGIEGYSNPSWVALLAVGRSGGLPITWVAKGVSAAAALAILAVAHRRLPRGPGTALMLAIACWPALAWWGGVGMETTTFTLLVWVGWGATARREWGWAMAALMAAAVTRPEGSVYVVGAMGLWALEGRSGPGRRPVAWAALGLTAWHVWRLAVFGSLLPMSVIAKSAGSLDPFDGLRQAGIETVAALPILALAAVTFRPDRRVLVRAVAPVALHLAMLLGMGGDWMGNTRMLMPGMVAGLAALATSPPRETRRWWLALVAVPLLAFTPARGSGLVARAGLDALGRHASVGPAHGLETPLLEDVNFIVQNVPANGRVETGDIGVPSLIRDVRIVDTRGLTDPARAHHNIPAINAEYVGDDAIACVRRLAGDLDVRTPEFRSRVAAYTVIRTYQYEGHRVTWWCRPGLAVPGPASVRARWLGLVDRVPELPALRFMAARWLADNGELQAANDLYAVSPWREADPVTALLVASAPLPDVPEAAGYRVDAGESVRTHAVRPDGAGDIADVVVVGDGAPGVAFSASWVDATGARSFGTSDLMVTTPFRVPVVPPGENVELVITRAGSGPGRADGRWVWVRVERGSQTVLR